jgi:hypothetical protein
MSFFAEHINCGCCGTHATEDALDRITLMRLERAVVDYSGLRRVLRQETGDAPFVDGEIELTQQLSDNAVRIADIIQPDLEAALSGTYVDEQHITAAMVTAGAVWQAQHWPRGLDNSVRQTLWNIITLGQHDIAFGPLLSDLQRLQITNGMSASAKYYTNQYFNVHVMPVVVDAVHAAVLDGLANDGEQLRAIRALLDRRLRSVPYWSLVANGAASRAYHYGYIKTAQAYGFTGMMFQATIDSRTSEICQATNGTRWRIGDLSLYMDRVAAAQGDEIKIVAPWLKASDVTGLTPEQMLAAGVAVPPLHGNCRSRLVAVDY